MLRPEYHDLEVLVLGEVTPWRDDVQNSGVGGKRAVPPGVGPGQDPIAFPGDQGIDRAGVVPPRQPAVGSGRAKATIAPTMAPPEWPKTIIVAGSPP
jgi:hypothetical protein